MSAADQHRADAERFQHWAASASSNQAASAHASRGFLSALLAIEARLGEIVDIQRATLAPVVAETAVNVSFDGTPAEAADVIARVYGEMHDRMPGGGR